MFALLPDTPPPDVTVYLNGTPCTVPSGASAAAAMLMHRTGATRSTALSGEARAPYCMMGVCFECLMEIDDEPNQQACLVTLAEGMRINRQSGKRVVGV